ncbi:agamous-like MADS-box protein AGL5 [Dioscorea cayenensis subsp. rotundata]|uniref:Agamous-like MADS-box protein AGL5 n=1 Tax=Dioscorea cayennensis subsp. rotundata TaxID=55577 RepID=A0AB40D1M6_DIOCR|nr:agamous-like MADS-box protein AGL5 [Dioscorea cayenensis subsp. rotundata]
MSIEASVTFTAMEPKTMSRMFTGELSPDRDFFIYSRHFNHPQSRPPDGYPRVYRGDVLHLQRMEFLSNVAVGDGPLVAFGASDGVIRVLSMITWKLFQNQIFTFADCGVFLVRSWLVIGYWAHISIKSTIEWYKKAIADNSNSGCIIEVNSQQYYQKEATKLRHQIQILQNANRHLAGEGLSSLTIKELKQLESRLERGIARIRSKKLSCHVGTRAFYPFQKAIQERNFIEERFFLCIHDGVHGQESSSRLHAAKCMNSLVVETPDDHGSYDSSIYYSTMIHPYCLQSTMVLLLNRRPK